MEEKLIAKYLDEVSEMKVFGKIIDNKRLLIRIAQKDQTIDVFRLVAWQGGKNERIYLHEYTDIPKQIGFIDITSGHLFDYRLKESYTMQKVIKQIILELAKVFYCDGSWYFSNELPLTISNTGCIADKLVAQKEGQDFIYTRKKDTLKTESKNSQVGVENGKIKTEDRIVKNDNQSTAEEIIKDICRNCRYRNICFKRYEKKDKCDDHEEGIAIMSDISQYDTRY